MLFRLVDLPSIVLIEGVIEAISINNVVDFRTETTKIVAQELQLATVSLVPPMETEITDLLRRVRQMVLVRPPHPLQQRIEVVLNILDYLPSQKLTSIR